MPTTAAPIKIREGLELWQPSDLKIEFRVDGKECFVLHFKNPRVFGFEFAVLRAGSTSFTLRTTTETTPCYIWTEAELALGLVNWESPSVSSPKVDKPGPMRPMVPPIIIPPGMN